MPMMVRQIHTIESLAAVNRIKSAVRKEGLGLSFEVPQNFVEKSIYRQGDEFLKDEHNVQMFKLGETLGLQREEIAKEIERHNRISQSKREQCVSGYAKIKNRPDANEPSPFFIEEQYYQITKIKMKNLTKKVKDELGLK